MKAKIINIGLIGFGTVGSGVIKVLNSSSALLEEKTGVRFRIKKIVDIDIRRKRDVSVRPSLLSTSIDDILNDKEIQVVIELTGSQSVARKIILNALGRGKHVITANKALLASGWKELFNAAKKNSCGLYFEASVGAGIPVIQVIREGMSANRISSIFGIVNGTTNYILSRMRKDGSSFDSALEDAKKKGFAEAKPVLDIGGFDSMHKLVVLASLAFGKIIKPKDIYVEGIDKIDSGDIKYADQFGYTLKLLAIAKEKDGAVEVRVHPTLLPKEHLLSSVEDEYNAIYIVGDLTGPILLYGKGAGQMSAASAIVGDLIYLGSNMILNEGNGIHKYWEEKNAGFKIKKINEIKSKYYLRFSVVDSPGVLSKISSILGKNGISIAHVVQKQKKKKGLVPVVMLTHEATERGVRKALGIIDKLGIVKAKTILIRVEDTIDL